MKQWKKIEGYQGNNTLDDTPPLPKYEPNCSLAEFLYHLSPEKMFHITSFYHEDDIFERAYILLTRYEVDIQAFIQSKTRLFILLCLADINTDYSFETNKKYHPTFEIGSKLLYLCMGFGGNTPTSLSSYPYRYNTTIPSHFDPTNCIKTDFKAKEFAYIIKNYTSETSTGTNTIVRKSLEPYIASVMNQFGCDINNLEDIIEQALRLVSICTLSLSTQDLVNYNTNLSQPLNAHAFALSHNDSYSIGIPHDFEETDYQRVLEHEFGHILSYIAGYSTLSYGFFRTIGELIEEGFTESLTTIPASYPYPRAILDSLCKKMPLLTVELAKGYFSKESLLNILQYTHYHTSSDVIIALLFGDAAYNRFKNEGYKFVFIEPYQTLKTIDPSHEYVQVIEQFFACKDEIFYGNLGNKCSNLEYSKLVSDIRKLYNSISQNITLSYHADKSYYKDVKGCIKTMFILIKQKPYMVSQDTLILLKNTLSKLHSIIC